jgi:hypothetical protein
MMLLGPNCTSPHSPLKNANIPKQASSFQNSTPFSKYFRAFVNLRDIMSKLKLRVTNDDGFYLDAALRKYSRAALLR